MPRPTAFGGWGVGVEFMPLWEGGRAEAVGCLGQLWASLPEVTSLKLGLQLHSSLAQEQGAFVPPGSPVPPFTEADSHELQPSPSFWALIPTSCSTECVQHHRWPLPPPSSQGRMALCLPGPWKLWPGSGQPDLPTLCTPSAPCLCAGSQDQAAHSLESLNSEIQDHGQPGEAQTPDPLGPTRAPPRP